MWRKRRNGRVQIQASPSLNLVPRLWHPVPFRDSSGRRLCVRPRAPGLNVRLEWDGSAAVLAPALPPQWIGLAGPKALPGDTSAVKRVIAQRRSAAHRETRDWNLTHLPDP